MLLSDSIPQRWPCPAFSNARKMCSVLPPPSQVPTSKTTQGFAEAERMASTNKVRSVEFSWPSIVLSPEEVGLVADGAGGLAEALLGVSAVLFEVMLMPEPHYARA